jgi:uncharacterized protein (DUF952 family)
LNKITLIASMTLGILIGLIIYQQQKPQEKNLPVAFVVIKTGSSLPVYLLSEHTISLSALLPAIGAKALENTTLNDCLRPEGVYKIVLPEDFSMADANSCIKLSCLDRDSGFIHTSYGKQVAPILAKFFKDTPNILVIELDKKILALHGLILKDEQNKPDGEFFPHIHGKQQIPFVSLRSVIELTKQTDETWLANCITLFS